MELSDRTTSTVRVSTIVYDDILLFMQGKNSHFNRANMVLSNTYYYSKLIFHKTRV